MDVILTQGASMQKHHAAIITLAAIIVTPYIFAAEAITDRFTNDIVTVAVSNQHDIVRAGAGSALALHFNLTKDWHLYASEKTAPGQMNLKIEPENTGYITFHEPIFPPPHDYYDKSSRTNLEVFSGDFTVYIPFEVDADMPGLGAYLAGEFMPGKVFA